MPLHDDTELFLTLRDALRTQLRNALRGEVVNPDDEQLRPLVSYYGEAEGCVLGSREVFPGVIKEIGAFPRFECLRDAAGWPNCDALYAVLEEALTNVASDNGSAAQQIQLMRQVNVLESYRKMLLHKKQTVGHYMAAWCACLDKEPQSLEELRQLMLNQAVGLTANSTVVRAKRRRKTRDW